MSTAPGRVIPGLEGVLAFESSIAYIDGAAPELSVRGLHEDCSTIGAAMLLVEARQHGLVEQVSKEQTLC